MHERSAQLMLKVSSMARTLVAAASAVAMASCVLPPEGMQLSERVNHLPEIDPSSLRPIESRFEVDPTCVLFDVSTSVRDVNDTALLFRFVANAGIGDTRHIRDGEVNPQLGEYVTIDRPIVLDEAFAAQRLRANTTGQDQVGVLSLFITDAQEWLVPTEDAVVTTDNLGMIVNPPTDGGREPYGVIEVRWTVHLRATAGAGCPAS